MRRLVRSAVQLPFFDVPGVEPPELFEHLSAVASSADDEGFDALFVMDHFFQLPFLGGPGAPMLEAYTLLSGLAARTTRLQLGTLVTGVTYRNPALLAKMLTTLDVISSGRAIAGLGAAWYEEEHVAMGFEYPPVPERMELLADTVEIVRAMSTGTTTVRGHHAGITDAPNVPAPVRAGGPPVIIGGSGERRTLPLAAQVADGCNLNCTLGEVPGKLRVLRAELERNGRSRDDLNVTVLCSVVVGADDDDAEGELRRIVTSRGMPADVLDDPGTREAITARMLVGGPDRVAEQMADLCGPDGIDGIVAMLPGHVGDPDGPAAVADAFRRAGLLGS